MAESTYRASSTLVADPDGNRLLGLETALGATPAGLVERPRFFSGMLARADVGAWGMLAVADVASARYYVRQARRRGRGGAGSLDPIVTASGDRLRFESFSQCNGVYARFDLLSDGIDAGEVAHGTTNVDINQPLRTALAGLGSGDLVHLDVGTDEFKVSTLDATHVERKVTLPRRWVKGLSETPVITSRMALKAELSGQVAARFIASLPEASTGQAWHLTPAAGGLRQTARPTTGSVRLDGTGRLAAASRITRFTTRLLIYGSDAGASAWVFELPGGRLTLVLSPEPHRGFSGEGGLLTSLANPKAQDWAAHLLEHLAWEPVIDHASLARATGLVPSEVAAGVDALAVSGKVGYDLAEATWFHRELPYSHGRWQRDNPRLPAARALVDSGAVTPTADGWEIRVGEDRYWVAEGACSCSWWQRYTGSRGPCSHLLAAQLTSVRATQRKH